MYVFHILIYIKPTLFFLPFFSFLSEYWIRFCFLWHFAYALVCVIWISFQFYYILKLIFMHIKRYYYYYYNIIHRQPLQKSSILIWFLFIHSIYHIRMKENLCLNRNNIAVQDASKIKCLLLLLYSIKRFNSLKKKILRF